MINFINDCSEDVELTEINSADESLIFDWRNEPEIILLSGSGHGVSEVEHSQWFRFMLSDDNQISWIIRYRGAKIGMLRFIKSQIDSRSCKISIYLINEKGKNVGSSALEMGAKKIKRKWPEIHKIIAEVIKQNDRSIAFFKKNKFTETKSINKKFTILTKILEG